MGKRTQARRSNNSDISNEKASLGTKWARKLHILDYHRWHYVKKVLAHKKHHESRDIKEDNSKEVICNNYQCYRKEDREIAIQSEERKNDPSLLTESLSSSSSPQAKNSTTIPFIPSKSSRATKIKKMITNEVTKRRCRHRSSTCPASSELGKTNPVQQQLEIKDEELEDKSKPMIVSIDSENTCGLCNTMNIECRLEDRTHIGKQAEHQEDDMDILIQDIQNTTTDRLPFRGKIDRSASFHHSKDFLDTMDVLSTNKDFFLRILHDHKTSIGDDVLDMQGRRSSKSSTLTKSETFPTNDPLCSKRSSSPSLVKPKKNSYTNESNFQQTAIENSSSSHSSQIAGRRFRDLRHKIKHLIKENRKERQRIAMDAVLHKVPYGQKINKESVEEGPCISICESDSSISPNGNKSKKSHKRRSPSLDESLDKYCQLFEITSFNREPRINNSQSSTLRVMDSYSTSNKQKGLGRIFSSPDLEMFLSNHSEGYDGFVSSRTPYKEIMSFSERKMDDSVNMDLNSKVQCDAIKETTTCKDLNEYKDNNNMEGFTSIDSCDENDLKNQDSKSVEMAKDLEVENYSSKGDILSTQSVDTMDTSDIHINSYDHEGTSFEDVEAEESQEFSNESPTFSYTMVDEDGENSLIHCISPKHHNTRVTNSDKIEFNYVRDILQLSGYLGSQLLGTWYSSDQPVDPSVFVKLETHSPIESECSPYREDKHTNHLLLFDMINEVLLSIYETSVSYWAKPLSACSQIHPMPKGYHVLEEVWNCMNWYVDCSKYDLDMSLDCITARDLAKYDRWMNLQFDAECVGLELEDLVFEDLLRELML